MTDERPIDPRLEGFRQYLDERVAEQEKRPYGERNDIEGRLRVYTLARRAYEQLVSEQPNPKTSGLDAETRAKYETTIGELDLSVRASNCLEFAKIENVGQLVEKTELDLLKIRSFGKLPLREVKRKLGDMGLSLKYEA